jgi:hypothetical protein
MSTTTKSKTAVAEAAPDTNSQQVKAPEAPRITRLEDVPKYELMVGKKFVRKDGSSNGEVYIPKNVYPQWVMGSAEMADGGGNSPFVAKFYVEQSRNGGEPETPVTTMVFGREVRARPQVSSFTTDCSEFAEEFEEARD